MFFFFLENKISLTLQFFFDFYIRNIFEIFEILNEILL